MKGNYMSFFIHIFGPLVIFLIFPVIFYCLIQVMNFIFKETE